MSSVPTKTPSERSSRSPSRSGPSRNSGSDVPLGIYLLVGFGFLGVILSLVATLGLFGQGHAIIGTFLLALTAVQAIVLVGLLRLKLWAWTLALFSYGLGGLLDLIMSDLLGVVISGVIVLYLLSIVDEFE